MKTGKTLPVPPAGPSRPVEPVQK